jgi:hypothetical protein
MKEALAVGLSDAEAAERFTRLIHESLGTTRTRINNALHMLARGWEKKKETMEKKGN